MLRDYQITALSEIRAAHQTKKSVCLQQKDPHGRTVWARCVHAKIPKGYTYEKESGKINPGGYTIDKAVEEGILEVSE